MEADHSIRTLAPKRPSPEEMNCEPEVKRSSERMKFRSLQGIDYYVRTNEVPIDKLELLTCSKCDTHEYMAQFSTECHKHPRTCFQCFFDSQDSTPTVRCESCPLPTLENEQSMRVIIDELLDSLNTVPISTTYQEKPLDYYSGSFINRIEQYETHHSHTLVCPHNGCLQHISSKSVFEHRWDCPKALFKVRDFLTVQAVKLTLEILLHIAKKQRITPAEFKLLKARLSDHSPLVSHLIKQIEPDENSDIRNMTLALLALFETDAEESSQGTGSDDTAQIMKIQQFLMGKQLKCFYQPLKMLTGLEELDQGKFEQLKGAFSRLQAEDQAATGNSAGPSVNTESLLGSPPRGSYSFERVYVIPRSSLAGRSPEQVLAQILQRTLSSLLNPPEGEHHDHLNDDGEDDLYN